MTSEFDCLHELANRILRLVEDIPHEVAKVALTMNLGELLAAECRTAEDVARIVEALSLYTTDRLMRAISGETPSMFAREVH